MHLVVEKKLQNFEAFARVPSRLMGEGFQTEMHRAVPDAGRPMLAIVRRTAVKQMGLKPGNYSFVASNTSAVQ